MWSKMRHICAFSFLERKGREKRARVEKTKVLVGVLPIYGFQVIKKKEELVLKNQEI